MPCNSRKGGIMDCNEATWWTPQRKSYLPVWILVVARRPCPTSHVRGFRQGIAIARAALSSEDEENPFDFG